MNIKTLCYIPLLASALLSQSIDAATYTLTFKNQRGSVLELNITEDNKIDGYFTTAVASKTCPQAIGKKQPITGYIIGNALTFGVAYPMCESVLSITGNFTNNQEAIDTVSILNHQAEDITHEGPGARFIGHDTYKKIS